MIKLSMKEAEGYPMCYCGEVVILKTLWTDENLRRRFFGCKNYEINNECGFFLWYDESINDKVKKVINGLFRRRNFSSELHRENGPQISSMKLPILVLVSVFGWFLGRVFK